MHVVNEPGTVYMGQVTGAHHQVRSLPAIARGSCVVNPLGGIILQCGVAGFWLAFALRLPAKWGVLSTDEIIGGGLLTGLGFPHKFAAWKQQMLDALDGWQNFYGTLAEALMHRCNAECLAHNQGQHNEPERK